MAAAKAVTSTKKSKTAKTTLKSPKTTKADKVATKTRRKHRQFTKEERLKTGLDAALVQKAAEALIKYHESQTADKLSLLGNDQPVQVQFTLLRTPETPSRKPTRIMIPHPLFRLKAVTDEATSKTAADDATLEEPEVCLIVKEESKPWCQEMIDRFPEHMGCVKKVMGLQSLREKHSRYEQRRTLLNKYNIFMADDRILPMLSKALGTDFYKAKKLPIPISLTRQEALPFAIQKALSATYMSISKGTCIMIRGGNTSMTPQQLAENIVEIADAAVPKMPHKWANIQNIAIKTPESVALPIYSKTPEILREIAAKAGIVQKIDTPEKEKKEKAGAGATKKKENEQQKEEKKRELKSPLLRALKKQKQEKAKESKDETPKEKKRRSMSEDSASKKTATAEKAAKKSKAEVETPKAGKKSEKKTESAKKGEKKTASAKKAEKKAEPVVKEAEKTESAIKSKKEESESKKGFMAAKKYQGSKKGYVFRMGKEGLGYYVDIKPVVDKMAMDALKRASKGKGGGRGKKGGRRSSY